MFRFSMLGWVGVAFLVVAVSAGKTSLGQSVSGMVPIPDVPPALPNDALEPRTCVVDEKVTDRCPDIEETKCPGGTCPYSGVGCFNEDGKKVVLEVKQKNAGATVQAAREATEKEKKDLKAFQPNVPDSPVVCYEAALCYCKTLMPGQTICTRLEFFQQSLYSWTASKERCLKPVLIEEIN